MGGSRPYSSSNLAHVKAVVLVDLRRVFGTDRLGLYALDRDWLYYVGAGIRWIPWSYYASSIAESITAAVADGFSLSGCKVMFASWPGGFTGKVNVLRTGRIDHASFSGGNLRVTVLLDAGPPPTRQVPVQRPKILCDVVTKETATG